MSELTPDEQQRLADAVLHDLAARPLSIGLVGLSGVGKSSTINTLFRTALPISHTVACTKEFVRIPLDVTMAAGADGDSPQATQLVVVDAPGLGEDRAKDPEYLQMYRESLPRCDVILWVTAARNRAVALDQEYLEHLGEFQDRMCFGLSQVDLVEPRDWKDGMPIPSVAQDERIKEIVADRAERFSRTLGRAVELVPYSSSRGYNLDWLFTNTLAACGDGRKWMYERLKKYRLEDFVAPDQFTRAAAAPERPTTHPAGRKVSRFLRERGLTGWDVAGLFMDLIVARGRSGDRSRWDEILVETVGRSDFRTAPLTDSELHAIEDRLRQERRQRIH